MAWSGCTFAGVRGGERCGGAVYSVRGGRSSGPGSGPRELIPNRRVPAAGIVGPPAAEVLAGPGAIGRWRVGVVGEPRREVTGGGVVGHVGASVCP